MSKFQVETIIEAGDVAAALTSSVIDLRYGYGYCVAATLTGAPSGTILIQGSLDKLTWFTLDTLTVSGTTALTANRDAVYYPWIRATKAIGGTGSLTLKICFKGA